MVRRLDSIPLRSICVGAVLGLALTAGCTAPAGKFAEAGLNSRHEPSIEQLVERHHGREHLEAAHDQYPQARYGPPAAEEARAVEPARPAPTIEQTQQLGEVLAELERQGAIDAATQAQLLDGLKQTDPALWPQLLSYFKAAAIRKSPAADSAHAASDSQAAVQLASAERPLPEAGTRANSKAASKASEPEQEPEAAATALATDAAEPAEAAEPTAETKATEETAPIEKPAAKPEEQAIATAKPAEDAKPAGQSKATEKEAAIEAERTWQQQLQASIARLEKETQTPPSTHDEIGKHAVLRMLYLAAGRREDALRPIAGIPPAHQDFWSKEIYGLAALMDHQRNPDTSRRAAEARNHLRGAAARLGELATLQVCNLTCCREVTSYGVYKPFESTEFHPGQELLLYAEIENFKSEHTDRGYHTALKASYQILDERGARVDEKEFALTEEHCQNARHDYFVRYFVWLPQKIYGGTYTLQLSVEDTLSQKLGQASVEFTIKPE